MLEPFIKYLVLHKRACIPGVGVFSIEKQPAKYHFNNRQFIAPSYSVTFTRDNEPADKKFYEFLELESGISSTTAIRQFNDFAYAMSEDLYQKRSIDLHDLGQISVDKSGEIVFESKDHLEGFFPEVQADVLVSPYKPVAVPVKKEPRVLKPKLPKLKLNKKVTPVAEVTAVTEVSPLAEAVAKETASRKDYWWVIAIMLAVMSIAAIVFYYVNNPQG